MVYDHNFNYDKLMNFAECILGLLPTCNDESGVEWFEKK